MSDFISRQDVIDAIQKRADEVDSVYSAFWEGLKIAQDIVEKVPSAEPERKWIPVTDALPEEETNVLVTVHYDGDKYYRYKPNDYVTTAEYISDRWCFADEEFIMQLHKHHVIAWAPLPKPWSGDDES